MDLARARAAPYGARVRVEVVRSGGFAGRVLRWSVVVEELPDGVASEVRSLLDQAPTWPAPAPAAPSDGFRWQVRTDAPGLDAPRLDVALPEPPPEPAQRLLDLVREGGTLRPPVA